MHLVVTTALAHAHRARGTRLRVLAPAGREGQRYASRMHLGHHLDRLAVEHNFPAVHERNRAEDLLEVRAVASDADALALASLLADKVRPSSPDGAQALFSCVAEMADNVAVHSGSTGFVVAQTYPSSQTVIFAVADAGMGMRASLAAVGTFNDKDALHEGLSGRSRLGRHSGQGLATTRRTLLALDGAMFAASGTASTFMTTMGTQDRTPPVPFNGTVINGTIHIP